MFSTIPAFASQVLSADLGRGSLRARAPTGVVKAFTVFAFLVLRLVSAGVRGVSRCEVRGDGKWPCEWPSFLVERVVIQLLGLGENRDELRPGAVW